jgi:hypothetical protein
VVATAKSLSGQYTGDKKAFRILVKGPPAELGDTKLCSKCGMDKALIEFSMSGKGNNRRKASCKQCDHEYRLAHIDREKECHAEYYKNNSDLVKAKAKAFVENNRDHVRKYKKDLYASRQDEFRQKRNKAYKEKKEERLEKIKNNRIRAEKANARARERSKTDPVYNLKRRLRALTKVAFNYVNARKNSKTMVLLGCSGEELLGIWGVDRIPPGFQIDHIVPLAQAFTEEEAIKLCHYSNLRIIPAAENLSKRDNKTDENAALCLDLLGREWID